MPEVRLGIIPAAGATQTLPRIIGRARALEMMLSGRRLNSSEAYEAGLANWVVPREQLLTVAGNVAFKIASYKSAAVINAKQALLRGRDLPLAEALDMERRLAIASLNS
jgi:enoyl-CoA hydratase